MSGNGEAKGRRKDGRGRVGWGSWAVGSEGGDVTLDRRGFRSSA